MSCSFLMLSRCVQIHQCCPKREGCLKVRKEWRYLYYIEPTEEHLCSDHSSARRNGNSWVAHTSAPSLPCLAKWGQVSKYISYSLQIYEEDTALFHRLGVEMFVHLCKLCGFLSIRPTVSVNTSTRFRLIQRRNSFFFIFNPPNTREQICRATPSLCPIFRRPNHRHTHSAQVGLIA